MLSNKERCDIDTIVIVPSEHENEKITDEEESEVGWDAFHARQHLSRGVLPRFDAPIQMYRKMTGSEYV